VIRALLLALLLAGCAAHPEIACLQPRERPMVEIKLFFGRGDVSDAEWADFAATTITQRFPDGFTILDGEGEWRESASAAPGHERTKILLVAAPPSADLGDRVAAVQAAYRTRFHQRSVGLVTSAVCGDFTDQGKLNTRSLSDTFPPPQPAAPPGK